MAGRRITYDNELEIMIEDYLANPLEAELERVIEGLEEEELADIMQKGIEKYCRLECKEE